MLEKHGLAFQEIGVSEKKPRRRVDPSVIAVTVGILVRGWATALTYRA